MDILLGGLVSVSSSVEHTTRKCKLYQIVLITNILLSMPVVKLC